MNIRVQRKTVNPNFFSLRAVVLGIAGILSLTLCACASLPTAGPVTVSQVKNVDRLQLGLHASGPVVGASPEDIVKGFLTASSSGYINNFTVARQFITGRAVEQWKPLESVLVYRNSSAVKVSTDEDGSVRVEAKAVGNVDNTGVITLAANNTNYSTSFSLIKDQSGEWRISALENGVILSRTLFETLFREKPVYFLTPDRTAIVADQRWFSSETILSSLTEATLSGPSKWLEGAVYSVFPAGSTLAGSGVIVNNGVAEVNINAVSAPISAQEQSLLFEQLGRTLGSATNQVQQISLSFAGKKVESSLEASSIKSYPYTDGGILGTRPGRLVLIAEGKERVLYKGVQIDTPALSYGPNLGWSVVSEGSLVLGDEDGTISPVKGTNLIKPSWDRYNWVWTCASKADGNFLVANLNGAVRSLSADWIKDSVVSQVAVSREGSRIAVAHRSSTGSTVKVVVAGVIRDSSGIPTGVGGPLEIPVTADNILGMSWIDESTVALLRSVGSETNVITLVNIGGFTEDISTPAQAQWIAAGVGENSILVGSANGIVYQRNANTWREVTKDLFQPSLAG